jgi:hypothetical protein
VVRLTRVATLRNTMHRLGALAQKEGDGDDVSS